MSWRWDRRKWFDNAHQHRFDVLLGALVLVLFSVPVAGLTGPGAHPVLVRYVVTGVFIAMLLSAVFAVSESCKAPRIAVALAVPVILAELVTLLSDREGFAAAGYMLGVAFLGYVTIVILRFIFKGDRVTFNTICAALCVYLLLGVIWALGYSLLEVLEPGSFHFTLAEARETAGIRFGDERTIFALYYSFVTMTTLGYGDILPTSSAARMLATLQAVMGQLYLAVLVARLVGLHIAQASRK